RHRRLRKQLEGNDRLDGPAVGRAAEAAADAEVEAGRSFGVRDQVDRVRLLGARGEVRQAAELGVVLDAQGAALSDAARQLEGRREKRDALLLAGEIEVQDRIERQQPIVVAIAEDRAQLGRAPRLLEAPLDERELAVDAEEVAGGAFGRP